MKRQRQRRATDCRVGLPTDGAAVRAWVAPMGSEWGRRLRAAIEGSGNAWTRGRARRCA